MGDYGQQAKRRHPQEKTTALSSSARYDVYSERIGLVHLSRGFLVHEGKVSSIETLIWKSRTTLLEEVQSTTLSLTHRQQRLATGSPLYLTRAEKRDGRLIYSCDSWLGFTLSNPLPSRGTEIAVGIHRSTAYFPVGREGISRNRDAARKSGTTPEEHERQK